MSGVFETGLGTGMVNEIVFHLGDCKTGTTSVQSVLAGGGWISPQGVQGGDILYPARVNHIPLAKTLSVAAERPHEAVRFARLRAAFEASAAPLGVVSAEHFEFVDPAALRAAIERHLPDYAGRIRLIAYVRPHADRLVSTFAERTKKGLFAKSLKAMHAQLIEDRLLFYTPRFEKWRALFGEAFTLRPFLRERLYQADVVADFFHFLFRGAPAGLRAQGARNESLSVEDIAMLRAIHAQIRRRGTAQRPAQQALGWYLSDLLAAAPGTGGTRPRLHRALARQVAECYRADAAALDAAFFDGTPMSDALAAAPDKAVERAQSFAPADHYGAADLRRFAALADLFSRMIAADPEHFMWALRPPEQRVPRKPRQAGG